MALAYLCRNDYAAGGYGLSVLSWSYFKCYVISGTDPPNVLGKCFKTWVLFPAFDFMTWALLFMEIINQYPIMPDEFKAEIPPNPEQFSEQMV